MENNSMAIDINGFCDDRFAAVKDVMRNNLETGADVGASFAATIDGEMVVDIWGGHLDEAKVQPWQEDSIVNVWSTTKTMSFLCALILADRGELDFDAPVAKYWPEFSQNGKDGVLVWHIMNHAAGLSGLDKPLAPGDIYNWEKMTKLLAQQTPWWEPGSATGYHALTQGYLIGEVVRRITGKSIGQFFREEVAQPLDADFSIGVPDADLLRIGDMLAVDNAGALGGDEEVGSIAQRTFLSPAPKAKDSLTREWRQAEIPAANGHGNARSVAKIHSVLACGGSACGVELLSSATAKSIMKPRISGTDMVLGMPLTFGLGFGLNSEAVPLSPNANTCFWAGWGGSIAIIDQDAKLSMSFAMNNMFPTLLGDPRAFGFIGAMYEALAET
jgi:CubicO group peptidase (beta-lactamase class C family)